MTKRLIEEDLFTKYNIVDSRLPEGQRIHKFLLGRAKALAGKYIDFDKTPVTFVLSDSDEANAFYAAPPSTDPDSKPRRDEYYTVRSIKNPIKTHVICITRGLLELVDNLDQLDWVLGHELTHMIMRLHGIERNSKGEEEIADLHPVDLVYDAGGDPKQAVIMSEKIHAYAEAKREKQSKLRYRPRNQEEQEQAGVRWSDIFDIHMTHQNRQAGLEASLTRLSHLIDDRTPTAIDKTIFDAHYSDPVDAFLKTKDYETQHPLAKLKILVDCIDHLSKPVPAEDYFQARLDALPPEKSPTDYLHHEDWRISDERKALKTALAESDRYYYRGPVLDKKYQQKIANIAESLIAEVHADNRDKPRHDRISINTEDLRVYAENKAYQHIAAHGYAKPGDFNYLQSSGVLYSYFNCLFENHSPEKNRYAARKPEPEKLSRIEIDIRYAKQKIRMASTAAGFTQAVEELKRLSAIRQDIRSVHYGRQDYRHDKLDDLSPISDHAVSSQNNHVQVYDDVKGGQAVPWDNLVKIAKTGDQAKAAVVAFLEQDGIEDFRISHGLPYIRLSRYSCYKVDDQGQVSEQKVPEYELDYAVHRDTVLQAYGYVRRYFENEASVVAAAGAAALSVGDEDFATYETTTTDEFNRKSIASKKVYDFISMFNALPDDKKPDERDEWREDRSTVLSLIPERYRTEHLVPGSRIVKSSYRDDSVQFEFSSDLLHFKNPIFQEHFGADFKEKLAETKKAQQQSMFDTAFALIKRAIDMYLEAQLKLKELQDKTHQLRREMWETRGAQARAEKMAELNVWENRAMACKQKHDESENYIMNLMRSIFANERYWFQLQRLTQQQKNTLAEFALKDEKGVIIKLFHASGYEHFCDYLGILAEQTDRAIAGNIQLADRMQVVAAKYDYQRATTKETLKDFVIKHQGKTYSNDKQKYAWYLHMFDVREHLQKTSDIDVNALAIALSEIQEQGHSCRGDDPKDLVVARYQNYKKFITQGNILPLVMKAIGHRENYYGLSCDQLLETADNLIKMRYHMSSLFNTMREEHEQQDNYGERKKKDITPAQKQFLGFVDSKIRGLVRKAENQTLREGNAFKKILDLYAIYHQERDGFSNSDTRQPYITDKEERLQKISALSENPAFWPEDALEHTKAFVYAKKTFLDDRELEDKILNAILNKMEALPYGKKKKECFFILLDKDLRAAYPETRERLFDMYVRDVSAKLGKDDRTEKYRKKLALYLKAFEAKDNNKREFGKPAPWHNGLISGAIAAADRYLLLRKLSDSILSQEQTSQMMKEACQIKLNSEDMMKSYLYGIGVDYLTEEMDRDPDLAKKFIQFFNSKGEKKDCADISAIIEAKMKAKYANDKKHLDPILNSTKPANCKILYENFWSAPLQARAVIIARVLKSAVDPHQEQQGNQQASWERVFDLVMDNLIHPGDTSIEAKYARDVMHSYIKSRSDYERELILSAMMVANRNIGNDTGNVGKALKLFLENMGPAEIKLGQAISSHPKTPPSIKKELQKLKSAADMPARWTLYDWIKAENIPEEFWKDIYVGDILGSASYYTTAALGPGKVLRILRPEAREKAAKGFRVILSTVDDLKAKQGRSSLNYRDLTSSMQDMVVQAAKMSHIETNHDIGQQQYEYAKDIYNGVKIVSDQETFFFRAMDWDAKGKNWMILDRAKGFTFNKLPEITPAQVAYKKSFAKGYIVFEMINIFAGKKFDHDKHGDQLSIDPETNQVGIYDTGAMALNDPTPEEQRLLGNIIYDVMKDVMKGHDVTESFGRIIDENIAALHKKGLSTQYFVEVKKGLLALSDFFKVLDQDEIRQILPNINPSADVSKEVYQGLTEKMSIFEKAQLYAFRVAKSSKGHGKITITREQHDAKSPSHVRNFNVEPTVQGKASWLQNAFKAPEGDADGSSPQPSCFDRVDGLQYEQLRHCA